MWFADINLLSLFLMFSIYNFILCDDQGEWFDERRVNENYSFKWRTDDINKLITIRVEVKTKGLVGFGFSAHGKTTEADMVYGWITDQGQVIFHDFWVNEKGIRSLDESQDWKLIDSFENTTHTVLQFSRHYVTCDESNDLEIYQNEYALVSIVWAYSTNDQDNIENIGEPTFQGVIHLNLFESSKQLEPKETDLEVTDYWMNITSEIIDQEFFCQIIKKNVTHKEHIVKYEHRYMPGQHFAHMSFRVITKKFDQKILDNLVNKVVPCQQNDIAPIYLDSKLLVFNAMMFESYVYMPENIGIPFGESNITYYLVTSNVTPVNTSLDYWQYTRVWTTKQVRKNEAGLWVFGYSSLSTPTAFIFPPSQPAFTTVSVVDDFCFKGNLKDQGIFMFAIEFHSHSARKQEIRQYRNDSQIRILQFNNYFDPNHYLGLLKNPINFHSGDKLAVICEQSTMDKNTSFLSYAENCYIVAYYYPNIISIDAYTIVTYKTILKATGLQKVEWSPDLAFDDRYIIKPDQYNNTKIVDFIVQEKYKIHDPAQLEELIISSEEKQCCFSSEYEYKRTNRKIQKPPGLFQAIKSESKLQNSCPHRTLKSKSIISILIKTFGNSLIHILVLL